MVVLLVVFQHVSRVFKANGLSSSARCATSKQMFLRFIPPALHRYSKPLHTYRNTTYRKKRITWQPSLHPYRFTGGFTQFGDYILDYIWKRISCPQNLDL